ncbi:MAG: O-antigen ligase family protein [Clostridia bacterium]
MDNRQNIIMETYRKDGIRFVWADKFFHSAFYIAAVTLIGIVGFALSYELYAIYAVAASLMISWVFCRDLSPSFLAMAIISMIPLARYGQGDYFASMYYVVIFLVLAYIIRLFVHTPPKIRLGRFFIPTLAVAVAITLGGLLYDGLAGAFEMPAIYYVVALGFGMLLVNVILETNIPLDHPNGAVFFAKMAVGVGVMGIAMVIANYYKYFPLLNAPNIGAFTSKFQFGNNLSNLLLITMPLTFYLSTRIKKGGFIYFTLGVLQYFALVFSLSRGGIVFGTLVFPLVAGAAIVIAKKNRLQYILILVILLIGAVILTRELLAPIYLRLGDMLKVSGNEARVKLYQLAYQNFLEQPIFGKGLGYIGGRYYFPKPFCIYWYHSTVFQIIGSLGLVGVAAYIIQAIYRAAALIKAKTKFNLFVLFIIIGFGGYSLVNVGYFVPLPCMAILVHIFILVDRNNRLVKASAADAKKENLPRSNYIDIVK